MLKPNHLNNNEHETPFNERSTRGFTIKNKIQNSNKITIINVPGFEPMHNILMLQLMEKEVYNGQYIELYQPGNLTITNSNFKTILHSVLKGEKVSASYLKPDKLSEIVKVLTQSCFILQNLNIMGAILTNYLLIRDSQNLKEILASVKSIDEQVNDLFNDILNDITTQSGKNIVEKKSIESKLLVSESESQLSIPC